MNNAKILVVEDEKNIRETLVDILEADNYEVLEASNGLAGLVLAIKEQPHIILSDINMPKLNGFELLQELKQSAESFSIPPFIFLTAKVERDNLRKGMKLGADDYITKPFKNQEILDAVKVKLEKQSTVKKAILEDEHRKISSYLHDGIQNTLVSALFGFRNLKERVLFSSRQDQEQYNSTIRLLSKAIEEIRDYSHHIKEGLIVDLEQQINQLAFSIEQVGNIKVITEIKILEAPSPKTQTELFRILQECINNIIKHSEAKKALIKLDCSAKELTLIVSDNGKGFDPCVTGQGLKNIQERGKKIGARVRINSELGIGTTVNISIAS